MAKRTEKKTRKLQNPFHNSPVKLGGWYLIIRQEVWPGGVCEGSRSDMWHQDLQHISELRLRGPTMPVGGAPGTKVGQIDQNEGTTGEFIQYRKKILKKNRGSTEQSEPERTVQNSRTHARRGGERIERDTEKRRGRSSKPKGNHTQGNPKATATPQK